MIINALLIAIREIRRNLMRSFLTVIGIVIGVAAVVTMVTLGRGATETVKQQISKMGNNLLILRPGQGWGWGGSPLFSLDDVDAVRDQVPGIASVAPFISNNATVVYQDESRTYDVQGTTENYFNIANWKLSLGRFFTDAELAESAPVCVIGETIRKQLFGEGVDPVGSKIRVKNMTLEVIGVTAVKGQGGFGDDMDDNMMTPYTTIIHRLSGRQGGKAFNQVMISGQQGYPTAHIVADVAALMRERRKITANEEDDFNVFDSQQLAEVIAVVADTHAAHIENRAFAGRSGESNIFCASVLTDNRDRTRDHIIALTNRTHEIDITERAWNFSGSRGGRMFFRNFARRCACRRASVGEKRFALHRQSVRRGLSKPERRHVIAVTRLFSRVFDREFNEALSFCVRSLRMRRRALHQSNRCENFAHTRGVVRRQQNCFETALKRCTHRFSIRAICDQYGVDRRIDATEGRGYRRKIEAFRMRVHKDGAHRINRNVGRSKRKCGVEVRRNFNANVCNVTQELRDVQLQSAFHDEDARRVRCTTLCVTARGNWSA